MAFSDVERLAEDTGITFPYESLADDELIKVSYEMLMSFVTDEKEQLTRLTVFKFFDTSFSSECTENQEDNVIRRNGIA